MAIRPILLLGDPQLWHPSRPVVLHRSPHAHPAGTSCGPQDLSDLLVDLRDTLLFFRRRYGTAKAIAAPQIGVPLRVAYVHEPGPPRFLINPVLTPLGTGSIDAWESCMSSPGLFVRTVRAAACKVEYRDERWREHAETARGDLAVVLQHECDHLNGILSLQRAADARSFFPGKDRRRPGLPYSGGNT